MTDVLTNPAWHALIGPHASHADSRGIARRYDPDISVFHAIDRVHSGGMGGRRTPGHQRRRRVLAGGAAPPTSRRMEDGVRRRGLPDGAARQLARAAAVAGHRPGHGRARDIARALTHDDVDAMVDLVTRTQPGPFRPGTIELGGYIGIFHEDALVAMAGRRFRPAGYCEVSAVCTDPSARRRGYASILTARVADDIAAEGDTPMLHVADDNDSARAAYEQLGFEVSRKCGFAAMQVPRSPR